MTFRLAALVAVPFAVLLTVCDQVFHVRTGTLSYTWHPQVLDQTVLVPLTFWVAGLGMLLVATRVQAVGPPPAGGRVADGLVLVVLAYLASGVLAPRHPGAFAVALLVGWLVRVWPRADRRPAAVACVVVAAGGATAEALLSAAGEFAYTHPDVAGVPWWLAPLYLHGALVAVDLVAASARSRLGSRSVTA